MSSKKQLLRIIFLLSLSTMLHSHIKRTNIKDVELDIYREQTLEFVKDYMKKLLVTTASSDEILLVMDVDGTLTDTPYYPKNRSHRNHREEGVASEFLSYLSRMSDSRMSDNGKIHLVISNEGDFFETYRMLKFLELNKFLKIDDIDEWNKIYRSEPDISESRSLPLKSGVKNLIGYKKGCLISVKDVDNVDQYPRVKAFAYLFAEPKINGKDITRVILVDDSYINIETFQNDIKLLIDNNYLPNLKNITLFHLAEPAHQFIGLNSIRVSFNFQDNTDLTKYLTPDGIDALKVINWRTSELVGKPTSVDGGRLSINENYTFPLDQKFIEIGVVFGGEDVTIDGKTYVWGGKRNLCCYVNPSGEVGSRLENKDGENYLEAIRLELKKTANQEPYGAFASNGYCIYSELNPNGSSKRGMPTYHIVGTKVAEIDTYARYPSILKSILQTAKKNFNYEPISKQLHNALYASACLGKVDFPLSVPEKLVIQAYIEEVNEKFRINFSEITLKDNNIQEHLFNWLNIEHVVSRLQKESFNKFMALQPKRDALQKALKDNFIIESIDLIKTLMGSEIAENKETVDGNNKIISDIEQALGLLSKLSDEDKKKNSPFITDALKCFSEFYKKRKCKKVMGIDESRKKEVKLNLNKFRAMFQE